MVRIEATLSIPGAYRRELETIIFRYEDRENGFLYKGGVLCNGKGEPFDRAHVVVDEQGQRGIRLVASSDPEYTALPGQKI